MPDVECLQRISVLETRLDMRTEESLEYRRRNDLLLKEICEKQDLILEQHANQNGFKNGAIFTLSTISALFGATIFAIVTYILDKPS